MKNLLKSFICFTVVALTLIVSPLYALDTTETFAVGPFTNFEGYYSFSYGEGGKGHAWDFAVGGGFLDNFCYLVSFGISNQGSATEIGGVGLGFIWTAVDLEKFAFDLMPSFTFTGNSVDGNLTYPGFDAFSAGIDFELNIMPLKKFQPYILIGFYGSYDNNVPDEYGLEFPLAVGAMIPVKDGIEFLFQVGWTPTKDDIWNDTERSIAIGLNGMATENLEIVSEVGYEFSAKDVSIGLAVLYAL